MTTLETELRERWGALPDATRFDVYFQYPLDEVRAAEREIEKLRASITLLEMDRDDALVRLKARVEKTIATEF